jgi:5-hydroxyisourate hydrolase-like protein (transthyretin family)
MVLGNPLKRPTEVAFGFGGRQLVWHRCSRRGGMRSCHRETIGPFGRRPTTRSVPYGRGVPVGGRLASASGSPLAGLAVELTESFDRGAVTAQRTTTVQTGEDGTFFAHLAPGPSRTVAVHFAGSRVLCSVDSRPLRLRVRTAVHLHASTATAAIGGAPVVFSGEIGSRQATIPASGIPVELQFRLPGSPWSEFRTVQTDEGGHLAYPYAFSDDDSRGVRFHFRAYVHAQPDWPYAPAASRPVTVTGR